VQCGAFHAGHELHQTGVADIEDESVDDLVAEVAVGHLASFEAQGGLHLVAFAEEADSLILLRLVVVFVYGDGEFHFFDDDDLLLLACSAVALIFFVEIFSVVLDLADWGYGIWRDLHQVERSLPGHLQRVKWGHYTQLFAVLVDHADLSRADSFVGTDKGLCGTLIDWWNRSPPQRAFSAAMRGL
jgi:hypothetical protein